MKSEKANGHKRPNVERPIPTDDVGLHYINCGMCAQEARIGGEKIRDYARLSVAFTYVGMQVFCIRHNVNVIHIDHEGRKHPATQEVR